MNGCIVICGISVCGEALCLFLAEALSLIVVLLGLVEASVNEMEETSAEATNIRANYVAPKIGV